MSGKIHKYKRDCEKCPLQSETSTFKPRPLSLKGFYHFYYFSKTPLNGCTTTARVHRKTTRGPIRSPPQRRMEMCLSVKLKVLSHTHTHFSFDIFYSLCPHETNTTGLTPALSELKENGNSSWIICVDLKTFFSQKLKDCVNFLSNSQ